MNLVSKALAAGLSIVTAGAALATTPAAANAHTARIVLCCQPDLRVGTFGDNIYSSDGLNQIKHVKIAAGNTLKMHFAVENDGAGSDHATMKAGSGAKGFGVTYQNDPGDNITTDIEAGTYVSSLKVGAGVTCDFHMKIKVAKSAKPGKHHDFLIQASSTANPTLVDALIVRATVK